MTASSHRLERTVTVQGLRLFVREQGDGRPILLINGLGSNADMWGAVEDSLAEHARTIVFDLPGSGQSPTPDRPLSISGLAGVVVGLVDELGYDQVDVLGFSLGGIVAQQLAHDAPRRVGRLALASTACGWGSMPPTAAALMLLSMPVRYHSPTLYWQTSRLLGQADRDLVYRLPSLTASRLRHPPPLLGYAFQMSAGTVWSSLPWLGSVRNSTLVLTGAEDGVIPPANGIQLARLLPKSRLHVVPNGGHLFVFDPDGPGIELLESFFSSTRLSDSKAWSGGRRVDRDEVVDAAFAASPGAFPYRALSEAYRRLVTFNQRNEHRT